MRLKKGDEVRSHRDCPFGGYKTGDIFTITAVDGDFIVFVDNDGNSRLRPDDEFELLPEATGKPPLTIETGKFYRTRNGRKVGPMKRYNDGWLNESDGHGRMWRDDGLRYYEESRSDLIAEWVDEPASNDNAPVAEQQAGTVFIDVSKAGPSQLHLAKGRLVKVNQGFGFELARYGDYVWVDTGKKQPVVAHINEIKEAA